MMGIYCMCVIYELNILQYYTFKAFLTYAYKKVFKKSTKNRQKALRYTVHSPEVAITSYQPRHQRTLENVQL